MPIKIQFPFSFRQKSYAYENTIPFFIPIMHRRTASRRYNLFVICPRKCPKALEKFVRDLSEKMS